MFSSQKMELRALKQARRYFIGTKNEKSSLPTKAFSDVYRLAIKQTSRIPQQF